MSNHQPEFLKNQTLLDSHPFDFSATHDALFRQALQETAQHHYDHCPRLQALWRYHNFHPEQIQSEADLAKVPFTMVHLFKESEWWTGSREDIALTLGSSGTGGQRSLMHLDQDSLERVKKLAYNIHHALGMTSTREYNYLCFTYDPYIAKDLGTAFTDELLTQFTGRAEVYYAFQWNEHQQDFAMDEAQVLATLKRFEASPLPTRILGFPAFLYQILKNSGAQFKLGSDAWVQTGGGWKGLADQEIPKDEFRAFVAERLGLPIENIRDLFGMVEHGIPYVDCPEGKLRIPNYARIFIRCPYTLKVLPHGERGLIQFMCSYNSKYPSFNLLSTDWGMIEETTNTDWGNRALVIQGRAGRKKHQGCALKALELLKKGVSP